jgi:hypothetical protein
MMTAAEPETTLVFRHNVAQGLALGAFEHPLLSARKVARMKSPHAGALIRRRTKSNPSLFCVASLT